MSASRTADGPGPCSELAKALKQADGPVSGQILADRFGITRAALQKRVQRLREMGFEISARTGRGYRLKKIPDRLLAETIHAFLDARWIGNRIIGLPECDSTNDEALKEALASAPAGTVVTAESQRAGRGRMGRQWHSPEGANIYLSVLLKPLPPHRASLLTLASAVAVAEAVHNTSGLQPQLKWPNDLLFNGRKGCGILTEMSGDAESIRWLITGIGCNVNAESFPEELGSIATSLRIETGRTVERARLAACILRRLEYWHDLYLADGPAPVVSAWRKWPNMLGQKVTVIQPGESSLSKGRAKDLDSDGALLLEPEEGGETRRILSGEVTKT